MLSIQVQANICFGLTLKIKFIFTTNSEVPDKICMLFKVSIFL